MSLQIALGLAILDIDYFKSINDRYGHAIGDRALTQFAQLIKSTIREADSVGRFGGEEFLLLFPDTNLAGAEFVLNRLLARVAQATLQLDDHKLEIRFSAGLARWNEGETVEAFIERADVALYHAKQSGRGRVKVSEPL